VSDVIDISKRLEDRQVTRDGLLAEQQDALLNPKYARALYSITLALAAYVGIEVEEFAALLERARTAGSINDAAADALAELRENLGDE
jgi:fucose permease